MLNFTAIIEEIESRPPPPEPPAGKRGISPWTEERLDLLKSRAGTQTPCSALASELSRLPGPPVSRGAVIGKMYRMGLSTGNTKGDNRGPRRIKRPASRAERMVAQRAAMSELFEASEAAELPPDQSEFAVSFVDVQAGQCRYPIGGSANLDTFRFCGAPQIKGCTYCPRHFRLTHTRAINLTDAERERRGRMGRRFGFGFGNRAGA